MQIKSIETVMNPNTFGLELNMNLALPIEPLMDQSAVNSEFYEKFGREFFAQLDEFKRNSVQVNRLLS